MRSEYASWLLDQRGRGDTLDEAVSAIWSFYRQHQHCLESPKTLSDFYALAMQAGLEYDHIAALEDSLTEWEGSLRSAHE